MNPIMLADLGINGNYTMGVYVAAAVASQMGAVFGVAWKSKNKQMKNMAASAGITAIFGITEPTVYGVTLRLKKPFICAYYAYAGLPGPITFVNALGNGDMGSMTGAVLATVIAVAGAFILVQAVGFEDPEETEKQSEVSRTVTAQTSEETGLVTIGSPLKGDILPLNEIHDDVFASGAMGPGVAVVPKEGKVYAPEDGTVSMLFDTLHAIGFTTEQGAEILIHVGMDTVKLDGKYFTPHTESGANVKKGELLLEFDMEKIKHAGYELVTPVIITNAEDMGEVQAVTSGSVMPGDTILQIKPEK